MKVGPKLGWRLRRGLAAAAIAAFFWAPANPAAAHAELAGADPPIDGIIEQAPSAVTLWFTERTEPKFSEIQVLDTSARRVDRNDLRTDPLDPLALRAPVGRLDKGTYTVVWKALSAVDGHVTRGAFAFTVGLDQIPTGLSVTGPSTTVTPRADKVAARVIEWAGLAGGVGAFPFMWWMLLPTLAAGSPPATRDLLRRRMGTLALAATGAAAVGTGGELVAQAAAVFDVSFLEAMGPLSLSLATGTRFGALWMTRMLFLLVLGGLAVRLRNGSGPLTLQVGSLSGAAICWIVALGSHAAAAPGVSGIAIAMQWLHLLAVMLWIGGLMHLLVTVWTLGTATSGGQDLALAARIVPRFSPAAVGCVTVLLATGLYQSKLLVGTGEALTTTLYGDTLLIKLGLVATVLLLAAVNLLVLRPRLQQADVRPEGAHTLVARLRLTVAGEIAFASAIFVVTAVLTNLQPAREAAIVQGISVDARADDLRATLRVQPGAAGPNRFELTLTDRQGAALANVERVAFRFTMRAMDLGESELVATAQADGRFTAQGGVLVVPGPWRVEAVVRRPSLADARPAFELTVAQALPPGPLAFAAPVEEGNAVIGFELAVIGAAVALATLVRWRKSARRFVPPAVGTIIVGAIIATNSLAGLAATVRNPIPPTISAVARGREIYIERCAVCHGDNGRGDGPAAAGLNPKPADLRVHLAAGHTDAQLFDWVSNGYPGSAMPAFRNELSDENRWNVLNFMRVSFGPGVPSR